MLRSFLTFLLLLNYLLVVCASVTERTAPPVVRPFAYVHHHDCQLKNAWRGGTCFEDCNGVQFHVHKGHKHVPLQQLLTAFKGIDLHCLPATVVMEERPTFGQAGQLRAGYAASVPSGVRGQIDAPPRRG